MLGYINKLETLSSVDGPGIRVTVFFQGCPLRCSFCHNPETWNLKDGYQITASELCDKIFRYKNYFGQDGGVTFSGGEPLLQSEFLLECLKICKKEHIHTCIDTSGSNFNNPEILNYVDLVLLDIKALNNESYKEMTGKEIEPVFEMLDACEKQKKDVYIRQVIIPNKNDTEEYIYKLKEILKPYKCVKKVELLPYHTMALSKYEDLKIPYRLKEIKAMDKKRCEELEQVYNYI